MATSNSASNVQRPGIATLERRQRRSAVAGQLDEAVADVDAVHGDAPPGELVRVTPRTAPDVEDAGRGAESERLDEEVDLLDRALRERVPEVRAPRWSAIGSNQWSGSAPLNRPAVPGS